MAESARAGAGAGEGGWPELDQGPCADREGLLLLLKESEMPLSEEFTTQMRPNWREEVRAQLRTLLRPEVRGELRAELRAKVEGEVHEEIRAEERGQ